MLPAHTGCCDDSSEKAKSRWVSDIHLVVRIPQYVLDLFSVFVIGLFESSGVASTPIETYMRKYTNIVKLKNAI